MKKDKFAAPNALNFKKISNDPKKRKFSFLLGRDLLFICAVLLFVASLSISIILGVGNKTKEPYHSGSGMLEPSEIELAVMDFWQFSLAGDKDKLNDLLTVIPDDYYSLLNECEKPKQSQTEVENYPVLIGFEKAVGKESRDYELNEVLNFSSKIKLKNQAVFKILDIKQANNQARVKVEYGESEKNRIWVQIFLLSRENNKWKIFLIAPGWYIESSNKYYAKSTCSQ